MTPYRPTLDTFVGQPALTARLRVLVDAALLTGEPMAPLLLVGPPGTGKRSLALAVADALEGPAEALSLPDDARRLPGALRSGSVVVLDRLGEASSSLRGRLPGLLVPPGATLVATAADGRRIQADLRALFWAPAWGPYAPSEVTSIASAIAAHEGIVLPDDVLAGIGRAAQGVPRIAARLLGAAGALIDVGAEPTLDAILGQAGISPDGLTDTHLGYLAVLHHFGGGAPAAAVGVALQLHPTVVADIERVLLRDELVIAGGRGRELTNAGAARLRDVA